MLRFEKEATIKSIYDFGDIIIFTISYYLDKEYCEHQMEISVDEIKKEYCEHQMEISVDEIKKEYGHADHTLINKKMDIEIQIFTDSNDKEIVTIRKI